MGMETKRGYWMNVELPRLGRDELRRLKRERGVPTFARDNAPRTEEPTRVSLRFDVATETEARRALVCALNNTARIVSPVALEWWPEDGAEGLTPIG
jgi:hypothetical protein